MAPVESPGQGQLEANNNESASKRPRAKHACRVCNSRRVRCNVTEAQPCSNCKSSGTRCEVLPSRRGRYPRKSKRQRQSCQPNTPGSSSSRPSLEDAVITDGGPPPAYNLRSTAGAASGISPQAHREASATGLPARTPSPSADSAAPGTLFFGESNFLTLVPGQSRTSETIDGDAPRDDGKQKARLLFPITSSTPQSIPSGASPASIEHLSAGTTRYLRDEGALTLPDLQSCVPALQAYFKWFHPSFPILDRTDFTHRLAALDVSYLLLQAMLFIGTTYCDHNTIMAMGFKDRSEAKSLLYTRARLLFHADWEKDEITLIQSLFLMSFWRGGPSDVRDVRYWLGVVIGVAESYGLHRSARFTTRDPHRARLRRRIWWSIYVRERQAAASLGLPSRIRDEDCDIEPLSPSDLESEIEGLDSSPFGSCKPEHITYAIKMVEIAKILGRIIDVHFAPGKPPSTAEQIQGLDNALEAWKRSLPDEVNSGVVDGTASVWSHLLHLAYQHVSIPNTISLQQYECRSDRSSHSHLRILIYRYSFLRLSEEDAQGQIAVSAASQISRIAEDMLAQGTLRYGQMHLITSLFAALCIHAIGIRRGVDVSRRIAEHRAQMCLLGLQEIQKYWRINNNLLDLFLQYLDVSIAKRLQGAAQAEATLQSMAHHEQRSSAAEEDGDSTEEANNNAYEFPSPRTQAQAKAFEDQYFNMLYGPREGEDGMADLGLVLQANDPMQMEGLNFLGRSL